MNLSAGQLERIGAALHEGAAQASEALGKWINRPTRITVHDVEQLPLEQATSVLGTAEEPICFCATEMRGRLTGHLILAFDDASGLALADALLGQPRGSADAWGEMERSAALETTNIVCCAYLNAMIRALPEEAGEPNELVPSPPTFARDFAESLVEFALMDQLLVTDQALMAHTEFHIDDAQMNWSLLFVPDAASMAKLSPVG